MIGWIKNFNLMVESVLNLEEIIGEKEEARNGKDNLDI